MVALFTISPVTLVMSSYLGTLTKELGADIRSGKLLSAVSAGVTSGMSIVAAKIANAVLIFAGPLAAFASEGIGLVLFGTFAACLIIALASGYRGAISGLSSTLVISMALIGANLEVDGRALFATTVAALVIAAVVTGAICFLVGQYRWSHVVCFVPYPVAAGFVGGIGGVICIAAFSVMGAPLRGADLSALFDGVTVWQWAPGLVYGCALYLVTRRWSQLLILPISIVFVVVACHMALFAVGMTGEEARAAGFLLKSTVEGGLWPSIMPGDLALVDWSAVAGQIPAMLALILVALICVVLNISGLELAVNRKLDWDKELRATGMATLVSGMGGGTVSTYVVPACVRSELFGASTRLTGIFTALVVGFALLMGDQMLELAPTALIGGMLVFAGAAMLDQGLIQCWKRLPRREYAITVLMFFIIVGFGLLEGAAFGIVATLVLFAIRVGKVESIEAQFTLRERQSNKARPVTDHAILRTEGDRVQGYSLRGYIFFGSVVSLTSRLMRAFTGSSPPAYVLLDFSAVSGVDFSAVNVIGRFLQQVEAAGARIVLCGVSDPLGAGLKRVLAPSSFSHLFIESDEDRALERCEDLIIADWKANAETESEQRGALLGELSNDLERYLDRQIQFEELIEDLGEWLRPRGFERGQPLMGPDAAEEGLQLIVSGRATAFDPAGARLYQLGPGDAIWPSGAEGGAVIADQPCRTMVLTPDARRWLESNREHLAFRLYQYLLLRRFEPI